MKQLLMPIGILLAFAAGSAQAHAHLKLSTPAEGAVLTEAPTAVVLTFSEAAHITAVSIQKNREPKQALKPPSSSAAAEQISVAVPKLAAGSYTLSWRMVSDDNHIMSGELHFKVAPMDTPMNMPMKH